MALSDLQKLTRFMAPYYQEVGDQTILQDYLTEYTYPECAASALWYELGGTAGMEMQGVSKVDAGAEKFVYNTPSTIQQGLMKQGDYYKERCKDLSNIGSAAIKVSKCPVGNITETFGSSSG